MVPPAPGLLSTMMLWPSSACSGIATRRATMSDEPPGANVTITRTGLVGQLCAVTASGSNNSNVKADRSFMLSTPSVCRVAPGRAQERHVIVRRRVRDRKPDRHYVEEPLAGEVRADVEHELISPGAEGRSLQERRIGAPVAVGGRLRNQRAGLALETIQLQRDAGARLAARGIQHVRGELTHRRSS